MPDLLGATNPVPGHDNSIPNRNIPVSPGNTQIQNVPDPTKVVRADGRTERQDSSGQDYGLPRYDSNFQTFLQRLRETPNLAQSLSRLVQRGESTAVFSGMTDGVAQEMAQAMEMLSLDEGQLLSFLMEQFQSSGQLGGPLFSLLRGAYARAGSEGVRLDILDFVRSYLDNAATGHLEGNMLRNLRGMADAMPASWGNQLRDLAAELENGIAAGDRQGNLALLRQRVFPYMSSYVGHTHDIGTPRALLSLLALDMARYENGGEENLLEAFHRLTGYGTLKTQLGGIDDKTLLAVLKNGQTQENSATQFADRLAAAADRALRGDASAETQEIFKQLVNAMLINESVYMPVNHLLIPLQMNGRMLFSELWVDPDADDEKNRDGRKGGGLKMLLKMDVQPLGLFDVVLSSRDKEVDLRIFCPERVAPFSREMERSIGQILSRNGLRAKEISVRKMERPVALTEVFPKIFEGMNSVNVKV